MNFCVYLDTVSEIQGYIVPDGYSKKACVLVRLNGELTAIRIDCWVFIEGARSQGLHQTGEVGFILNDNNVPGLSLSRQVELVDPDSGLTIYRRAQPGQYISKKVLRLETSIVPHTELDLGLKPYFQFYEHRVEHYGFNTIRQMLEILHQPSVYVSGRILLKSFQIYLDYNTDTKFVSLRDPFYELALRLMVLRRAGRQHIDFLSERDYSLFKGIIGYLQSVEIRDQDSIDEAFRFAKKDTLNALTSPFVQQLVADNPSELATLDNVSQALDALSQFNIFNSGRDDQSFPQHIGEYLGLPYGIIKMRRKIESAQQIAETLKKNARAQELLAADLILYHFVAKAEDRAASDDQQKGS